MAKSETYVSVVVESFLPAKTSGLHGDVHIRPIEGQGYSHDMQVECAKRLSRDYPVGTRFRLRAKLTDREGEGDYLYSYWGWKVEVLGAPSSS